MRVHPAPHSGPHSSPHSSVEGARNHRAAAQRTQQEFYPRAAHQLDAPAYGPEDDLDECAGLQSGGHAASFPLDAMASATVEPMQHLPANLIEFPRQLVAPRKARPRLAEGPSYDPAHESPQLNIFEVDPAQLTAAPGQWPAAPIAPPEWASIELEHRPQPAYAPAYPPQPPEAYTQAPEVVASALANAALVMPAGQALPGHALLELEIPVEPYPAHPLETVSEAASGVILRETPGLAAQPALEPAAAAELLVAPVSDRLLASVVDGALVTLAFLASAVVVLASTAHPPAGRIALIASGCGLMLFGLLYQFLFLSYAEEGTPGMRYARIALCTFNDDNPTIAQMRMRIPAMLLAAAPAGLGLLWSLFDRDHLAWHDRLTKTYQRKY